MALTTYDELKASIADWLAKGNLTSQIPDFIALLETRVNKRLSVMDMTARSRATTGSTPYIALPTDYRGMRSLKVVSTTPEHELIYYTPSALHSKVINEQSGTPQVYTIVDDQLYLKPNAADVVVEMLYYQKVPALSDANTSNWLLTDHPDIYLYGSLMAAEPFNRNDARAATWAALYTDAVNALETMDNEIRWSGPLAAISVRSSTP